MSGVVPDPAASVAASPDIFFWPVICLQRVGLFSASAIVRATGLPINEAVQDQGHKDGEG